MISEFQSQNVHVIMYFEKTLLSSKIKMDKYLVKQDKKRKYANISGGNSQSNDQTPKRRKKMTSNIMINTPTKPRSNSTLTPMINKINVSSITTNTNNNNNNKNNKKNIMVFPNVEHSLNKTHIFNHGLQKLQQNKKIYKND